MSAERRIVITADDFGMNPASSRIVCDLVASGRVSAVTALANSDDLPAQLNMLRDSGLSSVGLHHEATGGEIADELREQHSRLTDCGMDVIRLDSHCGALYTPEALPAALEFCTHFSLAFRMPRTFPTQFFAEGDSPMRAPHAQAVAAADRLGVALPQMMLTNTTPYQDVASYEQLRDSYIAMLDAVPVGVSEVFVHPGVDDAKRQWEARVVADPQWLEALEERDIRVVDRW